jgi:hypothetical protein
MSAPAAALVLAVTIGLPASLAAANGTTQREIQARVVRVDRAAQTLVVVHEFRGKRTEVVLRAGPEVRVFTCDGVDARLDRVKPGMTVTAFYEVAGTDGVANLIVVEPAP